jgi:hypothetical protein
MNVEESIDHGSMLSFFCISFSVLKCTTYQSMSDYLHDEYVDLMNIISSLIQ